MRGAVVLLIAAFMVLSTSAVIADTTNNQTDQIMLSPTGVTPESTYDKLGGDRVVLWDQYDTDGSNGLSHFSNVMGYYRALLDDFEVPEGGWTINDFHMLGVWDTLTPPQGTDFELSFWSDAGGSPGAEIVNTVTVSYTETATGRTWFGRPEFEVVKTFEDVVLPQGIYWIWGYIIGPADNCFWMAKQDVIWGSECWADYQDQPPLRPGHEVFNGEYYDLAFQLTYTEPCECSVDVEKYVWCPCAEEWIDADTENEALDLPICTNATFKIVIHNNGTCCDIYQINVYDTMHDSLEFIGADPEPHEFLHDPPYYYMSWYELGPLAPCETIEIYITAHVVGPECSIDFNYVFVEASCECEPYYVVDKDYAYVHAFRNEPPSIPVIDGPTGGAPGEELCWTFHSTDPNGDPVQYIIEWGDGTTTTTDCVPSCTPYEVCHTYAKRGTYIIKAKAKDCCWGAESDWAEFEVVIPRSRAIYNSLFMRFLESLFERFPNAFPILRQILY